MILSEYYNKCVSFDDFMGKTGGVVYTIDALSQYKILFINSLEDIKQYGNTKILPVE